jgi:hypothetical protein
MIKKPKEKRSERFSQEKKRQEYLLRQKTLRSSHCNLTRLLSHQSQQSTNDSGATLRSEGNEVKGGGGGEENQKTNKSKKKKKIYERFQKNLDLVLDQLCVPEWMIEIPTDLCERSIQENGTDQIRSNWFVMPRPEGKRCLVISSKGKTISYLESGKVLHHFRSVLPGGGLNSTRQASSAILDCIYCPSTHTYHILDLMNWNEMSCYECDVEFRFYWLQAKYSETSGLLTPPPVQTYSFRLIPYWECNPEGLHQAYFGQLDFIKNGLLFYHREGHYETHLTPLVLLWKDSHVSRYLEKDDTLPGIPLALQAVAKGPPSHAATAPPSVNDLSFTTLEGLPLLELSTILATSTVGDSSENLLLQINPGDLLRGYVAEVGYSDETGQPTISGFVLDTVSSPFTLYVSLVTSLLLSLGVQRSQGGS